jgi:Cu/Zn superoxide dismutase
MNALKCARTISAATLLATALAHPAAAQSAAVQSANAVLRDTVGQEVGTVSLSEIPAGVLFTLSLKAMPPGQHAFHVHAMGRTITSPILPETPATGSPAA